MTEHDTETPEAAPETETPSEAAAEASAGSDEVEAASDDDSEDEPETSDKKPKKIKINYEASMPRNEAVSYFEAIVGGLRSGRLEFRQEGETLVLNPPENLEIEVKASAKGRKAKVVFEIEWSEDERTLEILN